MSLSAASERHQSELQSAAAGMRTAQRIVGLDFLHGNAAASVPVDHCAALMWLRRAACDADDEADDGGHNESDSLHYHQNSNAADQLGDPVALYELGYLYETCGANLKAADDARAFRCFRRAAEQDHVDAALSTASYLMHGCGTERDESAGLKWYERAAELGDAEAANEAATCLESGVGCDAPEHARALHFRTMAAARGHTAAQLALAQYYLAQDSSSTENEAELSDESFTSRTAMAIKNGAEAVRWLRAAADADDTGEADLLLGECFRNGIGGLASNARDALAFWTRAGSKGNARAQTMAGRAYLVGDDVDNVPANVEEALRWFELAAAQGDADAHFELGCLVRSREAAVPLSSKSANSSAQTDIARAYTHFVKAVCSRPHFAGAWCELGACSLDGFVDQTSSAADLDELVDTVCSHPNAVAAFASAAVSTQELAFNELPLHDAPTTYASMSATARASFDSDGDVPETAALLVRNSVALSPPSSVCAAPPTVSQTATIAMAKAHVLPIDTRTQRQVSLARAVIYFQCALAIDASHPTALLNLAQCHERGVGGLVVSLASAHALRLRAASGGDSHAQVLVARALLNDRCGAESKAAAITAANRKGGGHPEAVGNAGVFLEAMSASHAEAIHWLGRAADAQNAEAEFELGNCHMHGRGVRQSSEEAFKWYLRAAERGHRASQLHVSRSFANGDRGAVRDPVAAERWAKVAAGK